jgi:hypothetical protein
MLNLNQRFKHPVLACHATASAPRPLNGHRGLWAYEVGETAQSSSATVRYAQIAGLRADEIEAFRTLEQPYLLPEVGSRMMIRVLTAEDKAAPVSWIDLQAGRFSYGIEGLSEGGRVKMVIGDYIAAEVSLTSSWET